MGGRISTILMYIKFGDDAMSSLDFSFIGGGVYLNLNNTYPVPEREEQPRFLMSSSFLSYFLKILKYNEEIDLYEIIGLYHITLVFINSKSR